MTRLVPWDTGGATGVLGEVELASLLGERETPVVRTGPRTQAGRGELLVRLAGLGRAGRSLQDLLTSAAPHLGGLVANTVNWGGQSNKPVLAS